MVGTGGPDVRDSCTPGNRTAKRPQRGDFEATNLRDCRSWGIQICAIPTQNRPGPSTGAYATDGRNCDTSQAECPFSASNIKLRTGKRWTPPPAEPRFPSTRLTPETLPPQQGQGLGWAGGGQGRCRVQGLGTGWAGAGGWCRLPGWLAGRLGLAGAGGWCRWLVQVAGAGGQLWLSVSTAAALPSCLCFFSFFVMVPSLWLWRCCGTGSVRPLVWRAGQPTWPGPAARRPCGRAPPALSSRCSQPPGSVSSSLAKTARSAARHRGRWFGASLGAPTSSAAHTAARSAARPRVASAQTARISRGREGRACAASPGTSIVWHNPQTHSSCTSNSCEKDEQHGSTEEQSGERRTE